MPKLSEKQLAKDALRTADIYLRGLSDDERYEILSDLQYCYHCGASEHITRCVCMRDD